MTTASGARKGMSYATDETVPRDAERDDGSRRLWRLDATRRCCGPAGAIAEIRAGAG